MATRIPGTSTPRPPSTHFWRANTVLPDPAGPASNVVRPRGNPPPVISSTPSIPVRALARRGARSFSFLRAMPISVLGLYHSTRDFRYGPISAPVAAPTEPAVPSVSSFDSPDRLIAVLLDNPGACATRCFRVWSLPLCLSETLPPRRPRCSLPPLPVRCSRSRRVPPEAPDALENLPKEAPRQAALGQVEPQVPRR